MSEENTHTVRDSHRADHYNQLADIARLEQEKAALELENALLKAQVERLEGESDRHHESMMELVNNLGEDDE